MSTIQCKHCFTKIRRGDDYSKTCFTTHEFIDFVDPSMVLTKLKEAKTFKEYLNSVLTLWGNRNLFGDFNPVSNRFDFVSYSEVRTRVVKWSRVLEHFQIPPKSKVGIIHSGNNKSSYYIAIFACMLKDIIPIGIDKTTIVELTKLNSLDLFFEGNILIYKGVKYDLDIFQSKRNKIHHPVDNWDDTAIIVYSSGSTGSPKGCLIPKRNLVNYPSFHTSDRIKFSWMASTGSTDLWMVFDALSNGSQIGFADKRNLYRDLNLISPTSFIAPPVFWNEIYQHILDETFTRDIFGSRIKVCVTGGSSIRPDIFSKIFHTLEELGISFYESYGASEVGGITFNNRIKKDVKVKLVSVPELGYYTTDEKPRGEIYVISDTMMNGYQDSRIHGEFVDGWYRTGDIGVFESRLFSDRKVRELMKEKKYFTHEDGITLRLIDRVKSYFKLPNSKFVSPKEIEDVLSYEPYVKNILVYFEENSTTLTAVVNLMKEITAEELLERFRSFKCYHIPSRVIIDEEWTVENQSLNTNMKIMRRNIISRVSKKGSYKTEIKKIFGEIPKYEDNFRRDCRLMDSKIQSHTHKLSRSDMFVTGGHGFIGRNLIRKLSSLYPSKNIYSLQRKNSRRETVIFPSNVINVIGNLDEPQLGLSDSVWKELCENVTTVYHSGAQVLMGRSYDKLRKSNVLGTFEIIKLCMSTMKKLIYVSTMDTQSFHYNIENGYMTSKWVSEQLIMKSELNYRILRPGLVGPSSDGDYNSQDWLMRFINTCIELKLKPSLVNIKINLLPIDDLVEQIIKSSEEEDQRTEGTEERNMVGPSIEMEDYLSSLDCEKCENMEEWSDKVTSKHQAHSVINFLRQRFSK